MNDKCARLQMKLGWPRSGHKNLGRPFKAGIMASKTKCVA